VAKSVTRRDGVPVVSVRPSWIQYPGEYNCRDRADLGDGRPLADVDLSAGVGNYWSYVDVRDVAGLVSAALDADVTGHEAVNVAAADNYLGYPTADAVEAFFGDLPADCDVAGEESALSTAKAADLLGWEPSHGWRDAADAAVDGPTLYE
jgi:nucleoside-diphosphate-sugar epimerase